MTSSKKVVAWRLVLLLISMSLGLLLVEGGVRARQWMRYGSAKTTVFDFAIDPGTGLKVPSPGQRTAMIRTDSRGFRNPELADPKPPGRLRLAFLGGSTTYCGEASSNETTWPHLVWQELQRRHPETELDYINAGVPGYGTKQSRRNFELRVAALDPDVIVIYHATNDLSSDTRELAREQGLYSGPAEDRSLLARWSLAWYLVEKNLQIRSRQHRAVSDARRLEFDARQLGAAFRDRLAGLVRECQQEGRVVALATFSHKVRREQSPEQQLEACNTSLYYMPYMSVEGLLRGFEEYNRVIREVAASTGAILIDGELAIPGDDAHFNDSVHLTDLGSRQMAERVVEALERSDAFRERVASRR